MATKIDAVAVASGRWGTRRSARKLADEAIKTAVAEAGLTVRDVGLLVNAGIYRDRVLGEPALSALIQEDVGANPEDPHEGVHGTFSFDVSSGACGPLTALQIADGFLSSGAVERVLIVASDADPGRGLAPGFPFAPSGAAAVCHRDGGPTGLIGFRWENALEDTGLLEATVSFEDGRNILRIEEDPAFAEHAAVVAAKAASALLSDHGLGPDDVDLVVAAPLTDAFLTALADRLGIPDEVVVTVPHGDRVHTAALLTALSAATDRGLLRDAHRILLICAGAGIVAGSALLVQ